MAPAAGVAFDGSVWVTAGSSIGLGEQKHHSISTACQDSLVFPDGCEFIDLNI